ncbi:MAG TPA: hypothetical protein VFW11_13200 [Cyclobacteriaceae bacterium]|nr:hypothetical protein [Cyclobacteriaceae bacterium]
MKKLIIKIFFMFGLTSLASAQIPADQTMKVNEEQVPIVVRVALKNDFGLAPDEGSWMVHMTRSQQGGRTITEAKWYSFNKRTTNKEKIEVRYSPEGNVLTSKGIERKQTEQAHK